MTNPNPALPITLADAATYRAQAVAEMERLQSEMVSLNSRLRTVEARVNQCIGQIRMVDDMVATLKTPPENPPPGKPNRRARRAAAKAAPPAPPAPDAPLGA